MQRVPHELHVLTATQRQLRAQLLKLTTELDHLLSRLPVHELRLALGFLNLGFVALAVDLALDRTVGREHFFHEPRREVYAGLDQHWMHDLVCASELSTARSIIPQARTTQALFVLLVPLLACFLVVPNLLHQVGNGGLEQVLVNLFDNVGKVG